MPVPMLERELKLEEAVGVVPRLEWTSWTGPRLDAGEPSLWKRASGGDAHCRLVLGRGSLFGS